MTRTVLKISLSCTAAIIMAASLTAAPVHVSTHKISVGNRFSMSLPIRLVPSANIQNTARGDSSGSSTSGGATELLGIGGSLLALGMWHRKRTAGHS
jgi:hypothetical protein